jgi:hypothetical protein
MPKLKETVRTLAEKARRNELPNRAELVALAFELLEDHRDHIEHYVTKEGDTVSVPKPHRQAANKAFEVATVLALKFEKADQPGATAGLEEFVQQVTESGMAGMLMTKLADAMQKGGKPPEGALQ